MNKNWTAKDIPNLNGKRAIVTGANSGLGFQTARELARAGVEVVLACRSGERGEAAARKILSESYNDYRSYAQTKLAMLGYAKELQRRSDAHHAKLLSTAAHPGLSATSIGQRLAGPPKYIIPVVFKVLGQDDAQGALPQLYAATAPDAEPGGYYGPSGFQEFKGAPAPAKVLSSAGDPALGASLWEASERTTGVRYDWPSTN